MLHVRHLGKYTWFRFRAYELW